MMSVVQLHLRRYFSVSAQQKINEKPQIIADYECGKAIPSNQIMGKIERTLGKDPDVCRKLLVKMQRTSFLENLLA